MKFPKITDRRFQIEKYMIKLKKFFVFEIFTVIVLIFTKYQNGNENI
jgi:hypothetical protein